MKQRYRPLLLLCLVGSIGLSMAGCSIFHPGSKAVLSRDSSMVAGETVPLAEVSAPSDQKQYCDAVAAYLNKVTDPKAIKHITVLGFQMDPNYLGGPDELSGQVTLDVKNGTGSAYANGTNTRFVHFKKVNGVWVCDGISTSPSLPIQHPTDNPTTPSSSAWPEGILGTINQIRHDWVLQNVWQHTDAKGSHIQVYAGAMAADAAQGVVVVVKDGGLVAYPTPTKDGAVKVVHADAREDGSMKLMLKATDGQSFMFDVVSHTFITMD